MEAEIRKGDEIMNYVGKAEQLLRGGQGQTEVPYSTEEQRLAAAQVLALLALAEAVKNLSASIDLDFAAMAEAGSARQSSPHSAWPTSAIRQASLRLSRTWPPPPAGERLA